MLARRFTIVCLLSALFGIMFATLVAETSRPARSWEIDSLVPCAIENGMTCTPK
ncbi:hypothetical protein EDC40_101498 [Aminobacter aminovorans]|jgi:ABC-type Fe3+ transport system permease subunit|uniref:Uncharacterized protein n=1 Tax=Aminobacter aminovorans TaxID=83263 RepID=A0A380WQ05_AMIAI|nr:hypothetical protein EDC40_101498 [Aminobacter aminovorans]SUU91029.1 Uncharacterised protein [Aminobacter aminovorans]